jgi:hypothetical protein
VQFFLIVVQKQKLNDRETPRKMPAPTADAALISCWCCSQDREETKQIGQEQQAKVRTKNPVRNPPPAGLLLVTNGWQHPPRAFFLFSSSSSSCQSIFFVWHSYNSKLVFPLSKFGVQC